MLGRAKIAVAGGLLAATFSLGATATGAVTTHHTKAGEALARSLLLRRAQIGSDWRIGSPAPGRVPPLGCSAFDPNLASVVERGSSASATFAQSLGGPFVAQTSYAYATSAQAILLWHRLVRPALGRCAEQSLIHGSGKGVSFTATGVKRLPLPRLPARAAAYRVTGQATAPNQAVPAYLDVIVLGRGATVSELSLASFDSPLPRGFELRLAREIARRMAST